jgi:hypothetical protein
VDEPAGGFGAVRSAAQRAKREGDLDLSHIKGRIAMHSTEKMPWISDGARQAHVESQVPVPSVMPAAMRAPTLNLLVF